MSQNQKETTMNSIARVIAMLVCMCVTIVSRPQQPDPPESGEDLTNGLIAVLLGPDEDVRGDKGFAALKQLRQLSEIRPIEIEAVEPLIEYLRRAGLDEFRFKAAEIIARGEAGSDEMVLEEVKCALRDNRREPLLPNLAVALALAENPSPTVTTELAQLASFFQSSPCKRMYLTLALAARGDKSEEWMGEVARTIGAPPCDTVVLGEPIYMLTLCYVAPKLKGNAAIVESLWALIGEIGTNDLAILAVIPYARLAPGPVDVKQLKELRALLGKPMELCEKVILHLSLARLGGDAHRELTEALCKVGSKHWGRLPDWSVLELITDTLLDDRIVSELEDALVSRRRSVRLGAIRMVRHVGPDARSMLPRIEKLVKAWDRVTAEDASRARRCVAGLDARGDWVIGTQE